MYPLSGAAAYDRAITVFSPDGKLYQVEYATKAAERGTIGVGIKYKDGVILAADRKVNSPLMVSHALEKIFVVEEKIAILYSGLVGDARALSDYARDVSENYRLLYNEEITTEELAKEIARIKQVYTQYGGIRPFGVVFLIAGYDKSPRLFETQPSGTLIEYNAAAVGNKKYEVMELLESKWKEGMKREAAIKLAFECIKESLEEGEKLSSERIVCGYVEAETPFTFLNKKAIEKYIG